MNPSANGWIIKLLKNLEQIKSIDLLSADDIYVALRQCGFIYGNNISVINNFLDSSDFNEEEICKVNLCIALCFSHNLLNSTEPFIDSVIEFYSQIDEYKSTFLNDLLGEKKSSSLLEKIIHKRILIDANLITRNFNYFVTNALLYIDVLAYKHYLKNKSITVDYIKNLEAAIETVVLNVLNTKQEKSKYDESLIKLFEQSKRYHPKSNLTYLEATAVLNTNLEARYILDMACMATWSDLTVDSKEQDFLNQFGKDLNLDSKTTKQSIEFISHFHGLHKDKITLLSSKNIVKTFYDNSSKMVSQLISRNSKRLHKELDGSKELMILLSQSTQRDLSESEQKKVQEQLLDIFKTIPSLAIFMLPGGALLLPLVVKYIPKLLPSAFDDNRIED